MLFVPDVPMPPPEMSGKKALPDLRYFKNFQNQLISVRSATGYAPRPQRFGRCGKSDIAPEFKRLGRVE